MEEKKAGDTKTEENRDVAEARLLAERRAWRKDHPPNFYARPAKKEDGTLNLFFWEFATLCVHICIIVRG